MNPKVSICIPAYKQVELLRKVLDSVSIQEYSDYELIVTDDSPNNAVEILLQEYNFKEKLKYFKNTIALGSPANWNYGISLAKGEYVKMLHADDFFTSADSLGKYIALLDNNPNADFGFSASEILHLSTNEKSIYSCSPKHLERLQSEPDFLFFKNVVGGPSATIYRRSKSLVYDTNFKWLVDVDFYMRVIKNSATIAYYAEPLICTIDGAEGQITKTVINDRNVQLREHILLFNKLAENNVTKNRRKYLIYFRLLFNKYGVKSVTEINDITPLSQVQKFFIEQVILSVNRGMLLTKMKIKFYNSWFNKNILKLELF